MLNEALARSRFDALRDPVNHRLRAQDYGNDCGDLHRLVSRHAQGAVLIGLPVGVEVRDVNNARSQDKGDAENSQDRNPGKPHPSPCSRQTHLMMTLAR